MTPLSDALTAAQRSALAALEKAYVAERIDGDDMLDELKLCGFTDAVDLAFLFASLDVLRTWGVSAPTMTERVAGAAGEIKEEASQKQRDFIVKLCGEKNQQPPPWIMQLTKEQASEAINQLQAGTYDPARWGDVPF